MYAGLLISSNTCDNFTSFDHRENHFRKLKGKHKSTREQPVIKSLPFPWLHGLAAKIPYEQNLRKSSCCHLCQLNLSHYSCSFKFNDYHSCSDQEGAENSPQHSLGVFGGLAQPLFITSEIKHILDLGPFCTFDIVIGIAGGTKHRRLHFHQVSLKIRRNRHWRENSCWCVDGLACCSSRSKFNGRPRIYDHRVTTLRKTIDS